MKKFCVIALLCSLLVSSTASAMADMTGGYTTKSSANAALIMSKPEFAFAYGILRHANSVGDAEFITAAEKVWLNIKQNAVLDNDDMTDIVEDYWEDLTPQLQKLASDLGFFAIEQEKNTPHFWDSCTQHIGPSCTSALKIFVGVAIVSCFVVTPVAAAAMPFFGGTYRDSCRDISVDSFRSTDRNIGSYDLSVVSARCAQDRSCHDLVRNEIVVPNDGSACVNIHNNNGTLVVTDSVKWSANAAQGSTNLCPSLKGSFQDTCKVLVEQPYMSSDSRVPLDAFCRYEVKCDKEVSGKLENTLIFPKASVGCVGKRIENCNGKLVVRKGDADDHQCNKNWRRNYKNEL